MFSKESIAACSLFLALLYAAQAKAEEPGSTRLFNRIKLSERSGTEFHPRLLTDPNLSKDDMLSDLRDARLSLSQVKQQAVNLFMEATRTLVTVKDTPVEHTPQEINTAMLDEKANFLPPRKEWLVFYMNTLEPIIKLMTDDMNDVETNGIQGPANLRDKLKTFWQPWKAEVISINKSMDELQDLITPDSGTNVKLAKTALAIFDSASRMEKVRFDAAKFCKDELSKE
ncbi:MAG: hypothetical protein K2X27_24220 [Candidatus Obscuribacterales bacterium]|nr:hypothetical protein [Candidatus Obscuribacterales bacterium]